MIFSFSHFFPFLQFFTKLSSFFLVAFLNFYLMASMVSLSSSLNLSSMSFPLSLLLLPFNLSLYFSNPIFEDQIQLGFLRITRQMHSFPLIQFLPNFLSNLPPPWQIWPHVQSCYFFLCFFYFGPLLSVSFLLLSAALLKIRFCLLLIFIIRSRARTVVRGRVGLSLHAMETSWREDFLRLLRSHLYLNFSSTLVICNWHLLSTAFAQRS